MLAGTTRRYFSRKCVMSPIFYVNAKPHIGHLYTAVYCDAIHRYNQIRHGESFFSIGTDEHGLKIQKKAAELGFDKPLLMCDKNADLFKKLFDEANIRESRFIRTTDADHLESVHSIWHKILANGNIVKGSHSGYYSTNEETFFPEKDLIKNSEGQLTVPGSREVCDFVTEENFVF